MIKVQRQDVVMADLGTLSEIRGHEQALFRPVIVIQVIKPFELLVIVPVTSKTSNLYSIVKLPKGVGGLSKDSFALCHQIRTISLDRVNSVIGTLPDRDFNKILTVLADFLDL